MALAKNAIYDLLTPCILHLYLFSISSTGFKSFRLLALTAVVAVFALHLKIWRIRALAAFVLLSVIIGPLLAALLLYLALYVIIFFHPEDGVGHRVGFEGFSSAQMENTIGALRALATADAAGHYTQFPYIEFDVRETKDGALVLFHDGLLSGRAFPGAVNRATLARLAQATGVDIDRLGVCDVTLEQLRTLQLGGRENEEHVPTLAEFLDACVECKIRRTLAVEIKSIHSDAARRKLLFLLTKYIDTYAVPVLDADQGAKLQQYRVLGWVGIIAFPHYFVRSFGEFGSPSWQQWGGELKRRGIAARCVHLHHIDFLEGVVVTTQQQQEQHGD